MDCWRKWASLRGVAGVMGVVVVLGLGEGACADDLPTEIRTGSAATVKAAQGTIDKYVQTRVSSIIDPANANTQKLREEIWKQVEGPSGGANQIGGVTPSAAFQSVYVDTVLNNLNNLLNNQDLSAKLNAAIIVQKLAGPTEASQLEPIILKLMADNSPAVALWGVKAAGALLPSTLNVAFNASKEQLTKGIVAAAAKHGASGAVVQEAYAALDVSNLPNRKPTPINLPKPMIEKCVKMTLEIMRGRINAWTKGVPPDPHADGAAVVFVTKPDIAAAASSSRLATAQHLMDLIGVTVARAGMSSGTERDQAKSVAESAARAMDVLMRIDNKPTVASEFGTFWQNIRTMNQAQMEKAAQGAAVALKAQQDYSTLKDPPKVQQATAAE